MSESVVKSAAMFDRPLLLQFAVAVVLVPGSAPFRWPWSGGGRPAKDAEKATADAPTICNRGTKFECVCTSCWLTASVTHGGGDDDAATASIEWTTVEFEEHRPCSRRVVDVSAEHRLRQRLAAWTNEECAIVADCRQSSTRNVDVGSGEAAQWIASAEPAALFEANNVVLGGWECGGAQNATRLRFVVVYTTDAELDDAGVSANLMDVDVLVEVVRAREHLLAAAVGVGVDAVLVEAMARPWPQHQDRHQSAAANRSHRHRKLNTWHFFTILALCAFLSTVLVSFLLLSLIALALLGYGIRLGRLLSRGEWSLCGKRLLAAEGKIDDEKGRRQPEQRIPLRPRTSQHSATAISMETL